MLTLPIPEHGISLHLFMLSLLFLLGILYFSVYSSYLSLGRFIPRQFILFVTVVSGIDTLISFSDASLLVHRDSSDFCVFILYPVTLLNSLITSCNFLLGFLCVVWSVCKQWEFCFFFSNLDSFSFFFSSPVVRTPKQCWLIVVRVGTLVFSWS